MSVANSINRIDYVGNGTTVAFTMTNILVYDAAHVKVYLDGVLQSTGYTVSSIGNASGAVVTFSTAPASGVAITLLRQVPLTQLTTYPVAGAFPAKTLETDLDLSAMAAQQLNESDSRALKVPVGSLSVNNEIPDPTNPGTHGKFLRNTASGFDFATPATGEGLPDPTTTKGDLITRDASSVVRLGVGPDGRYLEAASSDPKGIRWSSVAPLLPTLVDAKGDLLVGTAPDTVARKGVGMNGQLLLADSAASDGLIYGAPAGHLWNLTLANNGTDPTNDIDIAGGEASSDDTTWANRIIMQGPVMTKQLDAEWAAGTNAGGRVPGQTLADGTWHVFIFRRANGAIDYCFSNTLSFTLPDGGTHRRRIGSIVRTSGAIRSFTQYGPYFAYNTRTLDATAAGSAGTVTITTTVPNGIQVIAHVRGGLRNGYYSQSIYYTVDQPFATPGSPSEQAAPLTSGPNVANTGGNVRLSSGEFFLLTNTARQFKLTQVNNDAVTYYFVTLGWIDYRQ